MKQRNCSIVEQFSNNIYIYICIYIHSFSIYLLAVIGLAITQTLLLFPHPLFSLDVSVPDPGVWIGAADWVQSKDLVCSAGVYV